MFLQTKGVHAGERLGTETMGMRCGLSRSGTDGAYDAVSMNTNEEEHDMHSGSTLVLPVERNISKRYLGIVFVF